MPTSSSTRVLHLVSEATGQALESMTRACIAQFGEARFVLRHWNLVRSVFHVERILADIAAERGSVLSSLTTPELRTALQEGCQRLDVRVTNILDSTLKFLEAETGTYAQRRPGGQYIMDEAYQRRIDAMQYVIAHDDGQKVAGLDEADIVLVGVSRTSKTPTCVYLATRGLKAANVPLVPGAEPPEVLKNHKGLIVGLTLDPPLLVEIRRSRMSAMLPKDQFGKRGYVPSATTYVDPTVVWEEVMWAKRLCRRFNWPIINVSHRSVEETAARIMDMLEHPG
ncbi:pyruvate, water dikinase regulatory protein [Kozakia baliensis]|uniref:pyruvate, water dikinase regulatory protein n=1 Tax=Kozakia baliensis TaxID=153496 RepID=UPI000495B6FE|nr:pyruvate, water dikinase regulatory protein [Kozakia baliensis]AOX19009.1 phosphoenolpyruvate synthase regulatory protein [Kozakia baliensis]